MSPMMQLQETSKGWYYLSQYRKMGRNPLWVGPYPDAETAAMRQKQDDVPLDTCNCYGKNQWVHQWYCPKHGVQGGG